MVVRRAVAGVRSAVPVARAAAAHAHLRAGGMRAPMPPVHAPGSAASAFVFAAQLGVQGGLSCLGPWVAHGGKMRHARPQAGTCISRHDQQAFTTANMRRYDPGSGGVPPKDLETAEGWGPEVLNLRFFLLLF